MRWELSTLPVGRAIAFTHGLANHPTLHCILHDREIISWPRIPLRPLSGDFVIGWGRKRNTWLARRYAQHHGLPFITLEDGFLRSVGLGKAGRQAYSLMVDDQGIYYDANAPSRLTTWLESPEAVPAEAAREAAEARIRVIEGGLTKYNGLPQADLSKFDPGLEHVLVVDQVAKDLSLTHGGARDLDLRTLVDAAHADHPDAVVWVKTHPDVAAGLAHGLGSARRETTRFITTLCDPIPLLSRMSRVYVATSLLGFEAALRGVPVTTFGRPFYGGWGFTDDRHPDAKRGRERHITEVFAAAYVGYSRYVDLETGAPCSILQAIDSLQRQVEAAHLNHRDTWCFGFRFWKRYSTRPLLEAPGRSVHFCRDAAEAERRGVDGDDRIAVWGRRIPDGVRELAARTGAPVVCVEDGFIRSVGLGSDLIPPASLVVDATGIYFDATGPSDLERILAESEFTPDELARAASLRQRLVNDAVSKYNLAAQAPLSPGNAPEQAVVLVPGQVEDDASIEFGCEDLRTNLELLAAVREARPDAWIVYKPHPDVVAGNRRGDAVSDALRALCDEIVIDVDITSCLAVSDEVHTLTSLTGFEALLRAIPVWTYGRPFYAGWGLTQDRLDCPRRGRQLSLEELVAGTLLRYPRYYDWRSGLFTTPERVLDRLLQERAATVERRTPASPYLARQLRKLGYLVRGVMK